MPDEFDLDKALKAITANNDVDRAEWDKYQVEQREKLKANFYSSDAQVKFRQGIQAVGLALQQIEVLQEAGESTDAAMDMLAEGFALQGEYEKAQETAVSPEKQAEYAQILEAITRNDRDTCQCAKPVVFIKDRFYSPHHKAVVGLRACALCNFLNAYP